MTYKDRQQFKELKQRVEELRESLEGGVSSDPVSREEAAALLAILDGVLDRVSPQQWDRTMETIAHEAARRAGAFAPQG